MKTLLIFLLLMCHGIIGAQETSDQAPEIISDDEFSPNASPDLVDGSVACEECRQNIIQLYQPSLYQMVEFVRTLPRTDWDHGVVEVGDLLSGSGNERNSIFEFLCKPNNPSIKFVKREPSIANRILMGVAEKSLGETVGETVAGNPTLFVGYKYIAPEGSTVDRVGEMFNFGNPLLSNEALITLANNNSAQFIKLYRSPRSVTEFGGVDSVSVEQVQGGFSINEIRFQHITFKKDAGKEIFHGTHRDGREFKIYCTLDNTKK